MKDKDIRELWELCGYAGQLESIQPVEGQKEGKLVYVSLELTLDNLFKYALPRVIKGNEVSLIIPPNTVGRYIVRIGHQSPIEAETPAEAFGEACLKALRK